MTPRTKEPLFPFGFGLSYTSFSYSELKVTSGKSVEVSFAVKNTGVRMGTEVAQVYLGLPAIAGEPPKRLEFMSVFNVEKDAWELLSGDYQISVGGSSRDTPLAAKLNISVGNRWTLTESRRRKNRVRIGRASWICEIRLLSATRALTCQKERWTGMA